VLNCALSVPQVVEGTATGAALLAGVGSGVYENHEEAASVYKHVPTKIVEPNQKRVEILEQIYHQVYKPILEAALKCDRLEITKK